MPIQVLMTEGLVSKQNAKALHARIVDAFMELHEIGDNPFMLPNVIGEVVFIDKDLTFAGKQVMPLAIVELRVPSFTFNTQLQKDRFVREVTDLVLSATEGRLNTESIWVNAVYAVDGLWGIGGKAYSNEALGMAIQQAAG